MKVAVIKAGGKQYLVAEGSTVAIEKIEGEPGAKISFDDVLLVADGKTVSVGNPTVKGAKVAAEVVRQYRTRKIIVAKFKNKTRYMKRQGHRQKKTEIKITSL